MKEKSPSVWDIITPIEAAELLHMSRNSIYKLIHSDNTFPAVQAGNKWLIYKAKIPDWFEQKMACKQRHV